MSGALIPQKCESQARTHAGKRRIFPIAISAAGAFLAYPSLHAADKPRRMLPEIQGLLQDATGTPEGRFQVKGGQGPTANNADCRVDAVDA